MDEVLRTLIPVIGVSIPLVVVAGRFIVQPIVNALGKHAEAQNRDRTIGPLQQQLADTEQRLSVLERQLGRIAEEQEFQRNLLSSRSAGRSTVDAG